MLMATTASRWPRQPHAPHTYRRSSAVFFSKQAGQVWLVYAGSTCSTQIPRRSALYVMNWVSWKKDHVFFMRLFLRALAALRAVAPRLVRAVRLLIRGGMAVSSSRRIM